MSRRAVCCTVLLVVALGGTAVVVGAVSADGATETASTSTQNTIAIDHTLSQTPDDGQVDVRTTVSVPAGTTSMRVRLPPGAGVYETEGFRRVDDRTYEWTRSTSEPSLAYDLEGNVTADGGDRQGHLYAVTDEWALVPTPNLAVRWTGVEADVSRSQSVAGEGVAGPYISFLGPVDEHQGSAAGQRFRLVVPRAADMRESPADVLATYERAAERIAVGQRDPEVVVFVAPTGDVQWAATGVQRGEADLWVRDVEPLDVARNTWIHEYVHTRQEYGRTDPTRWTIEGLADYYAALVTYEEGLIDYEAFRERMAAGQDPAYEDVRLTEPATWEDNNGNYEKGALVVGHLDRRLRAETGGSIDDVVRSVNEPDDGFTHEEFLDAVEAAGNRDVRADAERFTETTATPEVWSRREHVAAFGGSGVRYQFASFAAAGPYREADLESVELVAGESLTATVRARNDGVDETDFEAAFLVDDRRVDGHEGTLDAGEETSFTVSHRFEQPGEYDLRVGGASATAVVREPGGVAVTGVAVEPTTAARGESVTVRATVEPTADRPGEGEVTITADGDPVATEVVHTAEATVLEVTTSFDEPGEHTVAAGDHSTTVTVTEETVADDRAGGDGGGGDGPLRTPSLADGAGFGAVPTVVAVLAVVLGARSVTRRRS